MFFIFFEKLNESNLIPNLDFKSGGIYLILSKTGMIGLLFFLVLIFFLLL